MKPLLITGGAGLLGLILIGSAGTIDTAPSPTNAPTSNTAKVETTKKIVEIPKAEEKKPVIETPAVTEVAPAANIIEEVIETAPVQNCHPSYSGACLIPSASDYDCSGGSGNGPYYTGKVRVVGPDVFGLDRDKDGWGCE